MNTPVHTQHTHTSTSTIFHHCPQQSVSDLGKCLYSMIQFVETIRLTATLQLVHTLGNRSSINKTTVVERYRANWTLYSLQNLLDYKYWFLYIHTSILSNTDDIISHFIQLKPLNAEMSCKNPAQKGLQAKSLPWLCNVGCNVQFKF